MFQGTLSLREFFCKCTMCYLPWKVSKEISRNFRSEFTKLMLLTLSYWPESLSWSNSDAFLNSPSLKDKGEFLFPDLHCALRFRLLLLHNYMLPKMKPWVGDIKINSGIRRCYSQMLSIINYRMLNNQTSFPLFFAYLVLARCFNVSRRKKWKPCVLSGSHCSMIILQWRHFIVLIFIK